MTSRSMAIPVSASVTAMATLVLCTLILLFPQRGLAAKLVSLPITAPLPEIDGESWALMEASSGWIVAHSNAGEKRAPASITKLMTNYVLFRELGKGSVSLSDQVSISEDAWRAEGSRMFADVNTRIQLEPLLKSTVIQSGNDAAIALAEHVGGSEPAFAALMNQTAVQLGLSGSNFTNSTGLPGDEHYMTATDILDLSAALIRDFPVFYTWYSQKSYTHNDITQYNRNKLLWKDQSVDGLKTGFTEAAGYCLVASAKRGEQRWIAVVLGSSGTRAREKAVRTLLEYGFKNYQTASLLDEQGGLASVEIYGGEVDDLRLQVAEPANIVVPAGREGDVKIKFEHSPYLEAPVSVGAAAGLVSLSLDGRELYSSPLVAMSGIKEGGWWKRLKDSIKLRFR